eukprot:TRINITY_DN4277_c0_g1_i1.p1 TRINITY_DN4277_c0_g1~~TRINITY_DN4277_c0_g1_i1.p1  ORF type:complete len:853 (-),score=267.01 TRINITY_DN4277_c0_g1_i1:65-2512(-)
MDPSVLKELAKMAKGLPPDKGMEVIMKQIEKIDPNIQLPDPVYKPALSRRNSASERDMDAGKTERERRQTAESRSIASVSSPTSLRKNRSHEEEVVIPEAPKKNPLQTTAANRRNTSRIGAAARTERKMSTAAPISEADKIAMLKFQQKRSYEAAELDDTPNLLALSSGQPIGDLLEPKRGFDFASFRQFHSLCARIEGEIPLPEIVLVGMNGVGKSELLEAIIGHPLNLVSYQEGGRTKRPLFVQLNNSASADKPRCLMQFDSVHRSELVQMNAVAGEILKHIGKEFSTDPIQLQIDYNHTMNLAIIDTPGLPFDADSDEYKQIQSFLEDILRPQHRLIVCVEEPNQGQQDLSGASEVLRGAIRKIDPQSRRTVWVYNKLNTYLDTLTAANDLSRFFAQTDSPSTYWTSLLSSKEREHCTDSASFLTRLGQAEQRDQRSLRVLNSEAKYAERTGIKNLRRHLLGWAWSQYHQRQVPKIFKTIAYKKAEYAKEIGQFEKKIAGLNLRSVAAMYALRYLELCQNVLLGTAKGNPSINGETMKEEVDEQFFSSTEWEIPGNKQVPLQNSKIYGGQQFERLFAEFKLITGNIQPNEAEMNNLPEVRDKRFFYVACESAGVNTEEKIAPLVEQLIERASFLMKRVPAIVDAIMSAKESKPNPKYQLPLDNKLFLPISGHLKDLFNSYVERISKTCRTQCMEEFYSTKTIIWSMSQIIHLDNSKKTENEFYEEIFTRLRDRIIKNVIRKIYNFFLVPFMNVELWEEIQVHYFTIDRTTLDEILESHVIEDYLDHELDVREKALDKLLDSETLLADLVPRL